MLKTSAPYRYSSPSIEGVEVIGVVLGLSRQQDISAEAIPFLTVGVLGGSTAFSAFSHETMRLLAAGNAAASPLNVFGQLLAGPVAVYLGLAVSRLLGA